MQIDKKKEFKDKSKCDIHLIYDKSGTTEQWRKQSFQQNHSGQLDMGKNIEPNPYLIPYKHTKSIPAGLYI